MRAQRVSVEHVTANFVVTVFVVSGDGARVSVCSVGRETTTGVSVWQVGKETKGEWRYNKKYPRETHTRSEWSRHVAAPLQCLTVCARSQSPAPPPTPPVVHIEAGSV